MTNKKKVTFKESDGLIGYELILKSELQGARDVKKAYGFYLDSLTLVMSLQSCPRTKLQKFLKKILTGVLGKYFLQIIWSLKVLICILQLFSTFYRIIQRCQF